MDGWDIISKLSLAASECQEKEGENEKNHPIVKMFIFILFAQLYCHDNSVTIVL